MSFDIRTEEEKREERRVIVTSILLMGMGIAVAVYLAFFADCSVIEFLPITHVPLRCLN